MPQDVFITGFGPFGDFNENPSSWLAARSGCDHLILPVTFHAADRFASSLASRPEPIVLMMGVNGKGTRLRFERVARNVIGSAPDVNGRHPRRPVIRARGPERLATTLFWDMPLAGDDGFELGEDAGAYLCNYVYYQSLWRAAHKKIGFLHVPPFDAMSAGTQLERLQRVLDWIGTIRRS
ncbi:MAG: hypothetical protein ACK4XJ_07575 [Fimbriimonadaceae bacterium]